MVFTTIEIVSKLSQRLFLYWPCNSRNASNSFNSPQQLPLPCKHRNCKGDNRGNEAEHFPLSVLDASGTPTQLTEDEVDCGNIRREHQVAQVPFYVLDIVDVG